MKTKFHTVALATALLAALATTGFAGDKAKVDDRDEQFIKTAAADSKAEAKIAELAAKKAESADVKELAEMLVTDHTALVTDLTALAGKKGVDLSAVIEPKAAETFQTLEGYSGKDFDKSFLKDMKSDHEKTISNFESEDKKVKDPDLKAFVEKGLPGLRRHLDKIEGLLSKE
jgi:putative membrane protein